MVGRTPKLLLCHLQIKASALKEEREHVEKALKDKRLKLNHTKAQRFGRKNDRFVLKSHLSIC